METIEIFQVLEGDKFLGFAEVLQNMLKSSFFFPRKEKMDKGCKKELSKTQ